MSDRSEAKERAERAQIHGRTLVPELIEKDREIARLREEVRDTKEALVGADPLGTERRSLRARIGAALAEAAKEYWTEEVRLPLIVKALKGEVAGE